MKKIAIIGAPCIDEVISPSGELTSTQLGGILYSYAAMQRMASTATLEVEIIPLTFISIQDAEYLEPFVLKLTNFNLSHSPRTYDARSNRVKLVYKNETERLEFCANILPELTPEHFPIELLASLDGIFINMISGFDISLDTLKHIRKNTKAYIHLDVHAMILGELSDTPEKPRLVRGVKQWREWLSNVDSVQMNEMEADWLAVPELASEIDLVREARTIYKETGSPKNIIITRAERGATCFDFTSDKIWNKVPVKREILNTTGSGDVFGAVYTLSKTFGTSEEQSLYQAEEIAGWNAGLEKLEDILV
ncbi:MAG TPA: carbohydrate kinase family protein [Candidatus Kapabacteria bacterium]|nr:carbohydrate kinase family protein [Candidatus Kapabacteria bacterium]